MRGTFVGVPIIRIEIFGVLYWGVTLFWGTIIWFLGIFLNSSLLGSLPLQAVKA